jgi:hypothetical protein
MKSQQRLAPLWKWSSDRPVEVTIPHPASTQREIGESYQFGILNRFLIENVSVGDHCESDFPAAFRLPEVLLGRPFQEDTRKTQGRRRGKVGARSS